MSTYWTFSLSAFFNTSSMYPVTTTQWSLALMYTTKTYWTCFWFGKLVQVYFMFVAMTIAFGVQCTEFTLVSAINEIVTLHYGGHWYSLDPRLLQMQQNKNFGQIESLAHHRWNHNTIQNGRDPANN